RRDGFRSSAGNSAALSRPRKRLLHRLDPAVGPAGPVPGGHRHPGSLAVPQHSGALTFFGGLPGYYYAAGVATRCNIRLTKSGHPEGYLFAASSRRSRCVEAMAPGGAVNMRAIPYTNGPNY